MFVQLVSALGLTVALVHACDCIDVGAKQSKRGADIVFRETVAALRDSAEGDCAVVFRVDRVWKGEVTETFEMLWLESDYACFGFPSGMLKVGNELLVYGSTFGSRTVQRYPYLSMPCATKLAKLATDIAQLGRGHKPKAR